MNILLIIYTTLVLSLLLDNQVQAQCQNPFDEDGVMSFIENDENENETNSANEKPKLICNSYVPKKTINNYLEWQQNYVEPNPMSSPCIRCGMCLAVAKEIDKSFSETLEKFDETTRVEGMEKLQENLQDLCSKGFQGYAMRVKDDNLHSLTCDSACNKYVQSAFDGKWNKKLRETCTAYVPYMDTEYLFHEYLGKTGDQRHNMSDYLCRSGGIFRDCSGLNYQAAEDEETTKDDTTLFGFF